MALIFKDLFTEASVDTALASHTPDTGTSWTETINNTTSSVVQAIAATDRCKVSVTQGSREIIHSADVSYATNEYDIEVKQPVVDAVGTDDPFHLLGRMTATNNHYGLAIRRSAANTATYEIFKKVAGTVTSLASSTVALANDDDSKFEIRDAAKKGFNNSSEIVSTTDNVLTATGKAGLGYGDVYIGGHDVEGAWELDDFRVTEVAAPAAGNPWYYYANQAQLAGRV